jgi:nicotinamidase/pyrazinamidase
MKKGLLIVDLQNDFLPEGPLAVPHANEIIPLVNELVQKPFDCLVASKDWHPNDHGSFADNHGKSPGEHIQLMGFDQILWPRHCVQGTLGAEFALGWDTTRLEQIIYKGTDKNIDSYSAFYDNGHLKSTGLDKFFKTKGVQDIYIAGLATDYCVKYSAIDALELGFNVYIIVDACRGVNLNSHDTQKALELMYQAGAVLVLCKDVLPL